MARRSVAETHRKRAKRLRANQTPAEQSLWRMLRAHRLGGLGFRRQVPIGPYVVDFVCQAERLIVEVDGGGHGHDERARRDAVRTKWLQARGYRVLRFWNNEVLNSLEAVLLQIGEACGAAATPPPGAAAPASPARGEAGDKQS